MTGEGICYDLVICGRFFFFKKKEKLLIILHLFFLRENCSWDEKLAMDFKNLQRRIACSVSTSCHTGFNTATNELYKCMAEDTQG